MELEFITVGKIVNTHGIRGEVKLRPITCDLSRFEGLETAYLKRGDAFEPIRLTVNRIAPDAVFLNVDGVGDRTAAERLRGEMVYVDRAHAVELDEDSTFICDLIGLRGRATDGRDLGALKDVLQPGGNDVYVFRGPLGEVLVPALKSVVARVDLDAGEILFDARRLDEVAVFDED